MEVSAAKHISKRKGNFQLSKVHLFQGGLSLTEIHKRKRVPRKSRAFALQSTSMPKNILLNMQNFKEKSVLLVCRKEMNVQESGELKFSISDMQRKAFCNH